MNKRFYKDLPVGNIEESSKKTISKEEILEFADRYTRFLRIYAKPCLKFTGAITCKTVPLARVCAVTS